MLLASLAVLTMLGAAAPLPDSLTITPGEAVLHGPLDRQQVIVTGMVDGRPIDLTGEVEFRCESPEVLQVEEGGVVVPVGNGEGTIVAAFAGQEARGSFRVVEADGPPRVTFEHDVMPILTRAGCNAGACHGKARGQNGFQLSLLGFDPNFDYDALTKEARGRRVFPAAPEQSLILLKGTATIPHGGGPRLERDEAFYEILRRWIDSGMPRGPADAPTLERITISPGERIMSGGERQQLVVSAHDSDGSTRDVTHLAAFASNESAVVGVSPEGQIEAGPIPGEAAITARFDGHFATCEVTIPLPGTTPPADFYANLPRKNFIDGLVWDKLQKLGITPSEPSGDAPFQRRAYLDVIGRLPTPEETRAFLADTDPEKRVKLVDRLLDRPEYADHWANKWVDLLRPNPYRVGIKAVWNLDAWIRDAFRQNMPYDQFARAIVTARGSTFRHGPATVFRDRREPEEAATMMSQLFLGIRLECAKCHHHPFEVWGQDDFYGFAAYFARIGRKGRGVSPPISGSEEILFTAKSGTVKHPLTGEVVPPKPLFGEAPSADDPETDPRDILADWMTSPENPYFARVIANRVWADLMVRGLVDPVDDLRATNPPTNGPLLEALAEDFREHGYDLKHLIRTIMTSYVYGLSTAPNERNVADTRNHSRHYRQRLRAEPLLDAITRHHAGSRGLRRGASRHEGRGALDPPDDLALSRYLRPPRPEPGPPLRAHERHVGRAGPAPDELAAIAREGHQRRRPRGGPGRERQDARCDRRGTVPSDLLPLPDRRGARTRPERLRGTRHEPTPGDRGPALGLAQLGGIRVQGLAGPLPRPNRQDDLMSTYRNCESVTRRDCLRLGLGSLVGGGLINALRLRGQAAALAGGSAPRASSCILIWMDGGPSHYETFDPKPDAPSEIRGEFAPIATKIPGVSFSKHMTKLAEIADKLAVVRSIRHDQGNHGAGNHYMMTGAPTRIPVGCGAFVSFHPSLGSVTAYERGAKNGLPAYFSIPQMSRSGGPNFLGAKYAPFVVPDNPNSDGFRVRDVVPPRGIDDDRFGDRRDLRAQIDRFRRYADEEAGDPVLALDEYYEQGYNLISSPEAQKAFDIHSEPDEVRDAYGRNSFGQRALLARRLVEAGVPFVTLYEGGWDHHVDIFKGLDKKLPPFEATIAALIQDLDRRGQLDSTLVVALGEFGRTPKINDRGGRDHWSNAMSVMFAGGGTPGGQVIGATDTRGFAASERILSPENFASTIYTKLGIDPGKIYYAPNGRPAHLVSDPTPIAELMG